MANILDDRKIALRSIVGLLFCVVALNAEAKTLPGQISGDWVVLAGMESMGPSPGRAAWDWVKATGQRITISKDVVISPFSTETCKQPVFETHTIDALSFYRDNKTPFKALGIHKDKVAETDINCDKGDWSILGVMPIATGVIVAGVQDGGYVIAVKRKAAPVTKNMKAYCKQLAREAARITPPKGGVLQSTGCWNADAYAVYAVTYTRDKGLPYTALLYRSCESPKVHRVIISNLVSNLSICGNLASDRKQKVNNGLTSIFTWVKGLDCTSSFRSRVGPMHASVVWLDSRAYRVCGFNWRYKGHKGFLKALEVKSGR